MIFEHKILIRIGPELLFYYLKLQVFIKIFPIAIHSYYSFLDELKAVVGSSAMSRLSSISSAISSLVGSQTTVSHSGPHQAGAGALDKTLVEMLDTIILMYFTAVHKQLSKVGSHIDSSCI